MGLDFFRLHMCVGCIISKIVTQENLITIARCEKGQLGLE